MWIYVGTNGTIWESQTAGLIIGRGNSKDMALCGTETKQFTISRRTEPPLGLGSGWNPGTSIVRRKTKTGGVMESIPETVGTIEVQFSPTTGIKV
jgi:hypothetical protein